MDTAEIEDVQVIWETTDAVKVRVDGEVVWIPKVCIASESEVQKMGDSGTLTMSEAMAVEKGLV